MKTGADIAAIRRDIKLFKDTVSRFAGLLAQKNIKVIFRGTECHTDGSTIVLPSVDALEACNEIGKVKEIIETLIGYVEHEVGHVLFTDFTAAIEQEGRGKNKPLDILANVIEDAFVERKMRELWRGTASTIDYMVRHVIKQDCEKYRKGDFFAQVAMYLAAIGRGEAYAYVKAYFEPAIVAWIDANLSEEIAAIRFVSSTTETYALARKIFAKIEELAAQETKKPKQEGKSEPSQEPEQEEGENASPQETEQEGEGTPAQDGASLTNANGSHEESEKGGEDPQEDVAGKMAKALADAEDTDPMSVGKSVSSLFEGACADGTRKEYVSNYYAIYTTEGDYIGPMVRKYKRDWIGEYPQVGSTDLDSNFAHLQELGRDIAGPLKATFTRMFKARGAAYDVRDLTQGTLDRRRLWRVAQPPCGERVAPRVFRDRIEAEVHNLAVIIAVNESGSMHDLAVSGSQDTRTQYAATTALLLGDVLHALAIPFGVFGHTTGGRYGSFAAGRDRYYALPKHTRAVFHRFGDLRIEWLKEMREPWISCRRLTGGLHAQGNTYDAEVVRYATDILRNYPGVTRRVVFMLDDGLPNPDAQVADTKATHLRQLKLEVNAARTQGVEIVGVGMQLDHVTRRSFATFYPNSVFVDDMRKLPEVMCTKLGEMLGNNRKKGSGR